MDHIRDVLSRVTTAVDLPHIAPRQLATALVNAGASLQSLMAARPRLGRDEPALGTPIRHDQAHRIRTGIDRCEDGFAQNTSSSGPVTPLVGHSPYPPGHFAVGVGGQHVSDS